MAAENENVAAGVPEEIKGKGKAVAGEEPVEKSDPMEEDEESSDEEENAEVRFEEEDGMEEIDLNNIVEGGRRTRGRVIDFAKAAEENPAEEEDDDEDDDFQAPDDSKMDED
ncbi:histone chaperone domain CHZ-domain-containing protein [Colletotrichum cereale]|nr:histone chaperone domain CHZ-domain-containing protein [Colletotrichum cereale]